MVATCAAGAMLYVLPMLLGRTYDMKTDSIGVDIYDPKDIEEATNNPIRNPEVRSSYMMVDHVSDKSKFLGMSGELGIKVSSGMMDIRGAGEYMRDTSNAEKCVEILIKMQFLTEIRELSPDAKPIENWETIHKDYLGTHVATQMIYGGEVYASVQFVARKQSYLEEIKAEVSATISKSGSFDIDAQGKLEKLASNLTDKAKMEIDFYSTAPLEDVPTTIEGLRTLVGKFKDLVQKVNNGVGVVVCVNFRPLSDFSDQFSFERNKELSDSLEEFQHRFENLRTAKAILRSFVNDLPDEVPEDFMKKLLEFSERLSKVTDIFYQVISNLNVQEGSEQLSPADEAFDKNSNVVGINRYTKEIQRIIASFPGSVNYIKPRGTYVNWGKRSCDNKASNILYIGYMSLGPEIGIGAGTSYQCLPENPDFKTGFDTSGMNSKTTKLAAVRYKDMSMFRNSKRLQDNVAPCVVCETPLRTTVSMFSGMSCPGDWVAEYRGYLASSAHGMMRAQHVCINIDPDTYKNSEKSHNDPFLIPVKMGDTENENYRKEASIPCVVCSK